MQGDEDEYGPGSRSFERDDDEPRPSKPHVLLLHSVPVVAALLQTVDRLVVRTRAVIAAAGNTPELQPASQVGMYLWSSAEHVARHLRPSILSNPVKTGPHSLLAPLSEMYAHRSSMPQVLVQPELRTLAVSLSLHRALLPSPLRTCHRVLLSQASTSAQLDMLCLTIGTDRSPSSIASAGNCMATSVSALITTRDPTLHSCPELLQCAAAADAPGSV